MCGGSLGSGAAALRNWPKVQYGFFSPNLEAPLKSEMQQEPVGPGESSVEFHTLRNHWKNASVSALSCGLGPVWDSLEKEWHSWAWDNGNWEGGILQKRNADCSGFNANINNDLDGSASWDNTLAGAVREV